MKLPRDVSGQRLGKALQTLGYEFTRQRGSHRRYTTLRNGEHHVVVPDHNPIKLGTLNGILKDVAVHHGLALARIFHMPIGRPTMRRVRARGLHVPTPRSCRPGPLTRRSACEICGLDDLLRLLEL